MTLLDAPAASWLFALVEFATLLAADPAQPLAGVTVVGVTVVGVTVVGVVVAAMLVLATRQLPGARADHRSPARTALATVRQRTRGLRPSRQCDPDAAGHRRPRAPSVRPSAA